MLTKCICETPDPGNWTVIHVTRRDRVIRCTVCRQIWHSTAVYTDDLKEELLSPFQWKQIIKTADYHKSEDLTDGEEDSYLDPAFINRFEEPDP